MHAGLHQFRAGTISWFRDAVSEEGRTRSSLARDLCALEGWTGDRGEPCPGSARKALPVLARKLGLELPAAQAASGRGRRAGERKADCPDLSLRCRLAELDTVMPEPMSGDTDRRHWEAMMATHHPQGRARAPGGQLRYRVCSSVHGRLGGIGFCAASWHQKARDDYIGWSADARAAPLSQAINNHRFLLLPGVRVHGLASRAPGLAAARVAGDREAVYKARPMMACSHVGPDHTGACHQAAGWQCCAQPTSGGPPGCTGDAAPETAEAERTFTVSGRKQFRFAERFRGAGSRDRERRVIARLGHGPGGVRPRFIVASLKGEREALCRQVWRWRGERENRIREKRLQPFADRPSRHEWWPNRFRLLLAGLACTLINEIRRLALAGARMARARCAAIRLKLPKIGAVITRNTRRIRFRLSSACPGQDLFPLAVARLKPGWQTPRRRRRDSSTMHAPRHREPRAKSARPPRISDRDSPEASSNPVIAPSNPSSHAPHRRRNEDDAKVSSARRQTGPS